MADICIIYSVCICLTPFLIENRLWPGFWSGFVSNHNSKFVAENGVIVANAIDIIIIIIISATAAAVVGQSSMRLVTINVKIFRQFTEMWLRRCKHIATVPFAFALALSTLSSMTDDQCKIIPNFLRQTIDTHTYNRQTTCKYIK